MNQKKHILFISSWFPTRIDSFSGDFVQRHAQAVSILNKVSVLHVECDSNIEKYEETFNIINENYQELIIYVPKSKIKIFNFISKFIGYQIGVKKIKNFDLIHANVIYFNLIWVLFQNLLHNKKFVLTEHWTYFLTNKNKLDLIRIIGKFISKQSSFILPVTISLKNGFIKNGLNSNFEIIPNITDIDLFKPILKEQSSCKEFLHISSLNDSQKNISGILNTALQLINEKQNFKLLIAGNGDLNYINSFIKKHKLENYIVVNGAIPHFEVAKLMQKADCFILFSNDENQPCVITESFACGLPVISTNVGGITEYFPESFGIIIEKANENELKNAMIEVINGKEFASSEKMYDYVKTNFSKEVIAEKFNAIYSKVLD